MTDPFTDTAAGQGIALPSPPTRDPAGLLDAVHAFLGRFVAYPSPHAQVAHTLWVAHTHAMEAWESTPRLAFLSPEPGSGKTRALEVTELLVPNPVEAVNVTAAYLFRKVADEAGLPTILHDEIDTLFGPRAKENEEIRGLLNAGHRRGAVAGRCVVRGKQVFTEEIPAYCAVALAGIGGLPDTILSRSIVVAMRRRAPNERVDPYRRREHRGEGHELRGRLARWAAGASDVLTVAWPAMPDGIADRDADLWEPLLAVADAAGGEWPRRARVSAVTLVTDSKRSTPSLGVRLLGDLRRVFGDRDAMFTTEVLKALCDLEEAPWGDLHGKALDPRGLANRLRPYGVTSKTVRVGDATAKGYKRDDLWDPWTRYLGEAPMDKTSRGQDRGVDAVWVPRQGSVTSVTADTGAAVEAANGSSPRPSDPVELMGWAIDRALAGVDGPISDSALASLIPTVDVDPYRWWLAERLGDGELPGRVEAVAHARRGGPDAVTSDGRRDR